MSLSQTPPPVARTARLESILQRNRGRIAALAGGVACAVFRVGPQSPATGVLDGTPIGYLPAKFERTTARDDLEAELFDLLSFIAIMDASSLSLGDLLAETQSGAIYAFAQARPTRLNVVVRCESRATISRPTDATTENAQLGPNLGPQIIASGTRSSESSVDDLTARVLTLSAGAYVFADPPATVAAVPIGVQPTSRARPAHREGLATSTDVERFVGYVPPLGVALRDNDELALSDNSGIIYTVDQVYTASVGTVGSILLLTKRGA